jgi:hypothetical protein
MNAKGEAKMLIKAVARLPTILIAKSSDQSDLRRLVHEADCVVRT